MTVLHRAHVGQRGRITVDPGPRGSPEFLRHGQIERRRGDQQLAHLFEQEPETFILGGLVGIAEIAPQLRADIVTQQGVPALEQAQVVVGGRTAGRH